MSIAQDDTASGHARALAARRWGNTAVVRSAQVVIERSAELPAEVRATLHEVTAPAPGEADGDG